jgi:integrase
MGAGRRDAADAAVVELVRPVRAVPRGAPCLLNARWTRWVGDVRRPQVPGYLTGRPSRNKGRRSPADPPRTEEIIAVMRCAGDGLHGARARGLIVVVWRVGLRIQEALDLSELDLDARRGSVLVRCGKDGRRREVGMDDWAFDQLQPWLTARQSMPVGPLFASSMGTPADARGQPPPRAPHSDAAPHTPACAAASSPTSSVTDTRSSSPAKACRSTSSNANSGTATSA